MSDATMGYAQDGWATARRYAAALSACERERDEARALLRACRDAFDQSLNSYWSRELGELLARLDAVLAKATT